MSDDGWGTAVSRRSRRRNQNREPSHARPSPTVVDTSLANARAAQRSSPPSEAAVATSKRMAKTVRRIARDMSFTIPSLFHLGTVSRIVGLGLGSVEDNLSTVPQLALLLALKTAAGGSPTTEVYDPLMGSVDVLLAEAIGMGVAEPDFVISSTGCGTTLVYAPHCPHAVTGRCLVAAARAAAESLVLIGNPLDGLFPSLSPSCFTSCLFEVPYDQRPEAFHGTWVTVFRAAGVVLGELEADVMRYEGVETL